MIAIRGSGALVVDPGFARFGAGFNELGNGELQGRMMVASSDLFQLVGSCLELQQEQVSELSVVR